ARPRLAGVRAVSPGRNGPRRTQPRRQPRRALRQPPHHPRASRRRRIGAATGRRHAHGGTPEMTRPSSIGAIAALVLLASTLAFAVDPVTPRTFNPPPRTSWKPSGCRTAPTTNAILGSRDRWRMLHSDAVNSDEVSIALAP